MYLIIILTAMLIVTVFNWLVLGWTFLSALFWVTAITGIEIVITILLAIITGLCMPKKIYQERKIYAVSKRELNFYHALHINAWKDRVCELGCLGGFSKKKVAAPNDPAYIDRFILEINKGMFMHTIGTLGSFLVLFVPVPGFWSITFVVACVGAVLNILPLMVLRYNKPRLLMLKSRLMRNQKNTSAPKDDAKTDQNAVQSESK